MEDNSPLTAWSVLILTYSSFPWFPLYFSSRSDKLTRLHNMTDMQHCPSADCSMYSTLEM